MSSEEEVEETTEEAAEEEEPERYDVSPDHIETMISIVELLSAVVNNKIDEGSFKQQALILLKPFEEARHRKVKSKKSRSRKR